MIKNTILKSNPISEYSGIQIGSVPSDRQTGRVPSGGQLRFAPAGVRTGRVPSGIQIRNIPSGKPERQ